MNEGRNESWFGFRRVDAAEKTELVRGVFSSVAGRYVLMNDLMSGGIHRLSKAAMIDWLNPRNGQRFIDVGGGTGDIAFRIHERAPETEITVCDLTPEMLANMKKGQNLIVQAINSNGAPLTLPLPLAEFAKAYDGPPTDPKVFEETQKKLQEELQKRAAEARAKLEATQPGAAGTPPAK